MADPTENPDQPALTDAEVAALAIEHRAATQAALALHREAERLDTVDARMEAARAAILARRPAAAVRHLTRAGEIAGHDQPAELVALKREAEIAVRHAARPSARAGAVFLEALVTALNMDTAQDRATRVEPDFATATVLQLPSSTTSPPARSYTAVDIINHALERLGCPQRLRLVERGDGYLDALTEQGRADRVRAEALSAQPDDGHPCEGCGAPRWTFAHDDDLGEHCGACGWPHPLGILGSARHRATARELAERAKTLETEVAGRDRKLAETRAELDKANGKIEKLKRPAQILSGRRGRQVVVPGMAPATIPEDASIDDLMAIARKAVEQLTGLAAGAAATLQQVEAAGVLARQKAGDA